ncbi:MAG: DUF1016 N-terminal domain-containing protein [Bacteroidota bacterium]|nr:DUF1016 N-terminal domain-containing protein [Bacteroidota bacterium]
MVEHEQNGKDRADYGGETLKALSDKLSETGTKGFSDRNLRLYRQFYFEYPMIWQFLIAKFQDSGNQLFRIWQLGIAKSQVKLKGLEHNHESVPIDILIDKLSYTHFVELIKITEPLKRTFYEFQTIKNNWNVQQLQRNINSMLYERVGLSKDKKTCWQSSKTKACN